MYMDSVLAMGCSSSCAIFEKFSTAIEWIAVHKLGIRIMVHVINDFLIIAESEASCVDCLRRFQKFCGKGGIPLSPKKTVGSATMLPLLGITLHTVPLEAMAVRKTFLTVTIAAPSSKPSDSCPAIASAYSLTHPGDWVIGL